MKIVQPHRIAMIGAFSSAVIWSLVLGLIWAVLAFVASVDNRQANLATVVAGGWAMIAAFAVPLTLRAPFARRALRYEITATEVVERHGLFWRAERRAPILSIVTITESSGPLGRRMGVCSLHLVGAGIILRDVADGLQLHRLLISRRDSLRESALSGDLPLAGSPHEFLLERVAIALEREHRS